MGCAGSNPLPMGDTVQSAASNGHAVAVEPPLNMATADGDDKPCSMVQKVIGSVNVDDVVKKIQDVTGSMENLMDDTQEKLGSLFGKVEQKADDIQEKVENKVNDVTSDMPEKPQVNEIILLTVEETRIIPIDEIKSEILTGGNESLVNEVSNETKEDLTNETEEKVTNETKELTNETREEQTVEVKADDSTIEESEEQNEGEEEKAKIDKIEEENIEGEEEKPMDKE